MSQELIITVYMSRFGQLIAIDLNFHDKKFCVRKYHHRVGKHHLKNGKNLKNSSFYTVVPKIPNVLKKLNI